MKKTALRQLKKYRVKVFLAPVLKLFECICELAVPFLVKFIVDDGLTVGGAHYHDQGFIFSLVGVMFALAFAGFAVTMITQYLAARVSSNYAYDLKKDLFAQIQAVSSSQLERFGEAKALNLVNNDSFFLQNGVMMFMRLLVRAPFIVIGSVVASFFVNVYGGLVVLGSLLICSAVVAIVMALTPKQYGRLQSELDHLSTLGEDTIDGGRVIRAFNKQGERVSEFEVASEKYRKQAITIARINAFVNPLTFAAVNAGIILVLYLGSFQLDSTGISPGSIIAIISYFTQCLTALILFTRLTTSLSKAFASKKRVDAFFALEPEIIDGGLESEPELKQGDAYYELKDVAVSFGGESHALSHIDLTIHKGETIGIIGGTGSGKSTLLGLLERFIDPCEGEILYKGHPIKDSKLNSIRKDIALVSQKSQLFRGSIRDNLLLGAGERSEEEILSASKDAMSYEFVSRYEDGFDHKVEENGSNFSGGQKQRILLTRALLSNRPILILDDSTSALDYQTDLTVRKNIKKREGLTTILVSQRATSIKDCDVIYVLDQGAIVGKGKHEELLKDCPIYQEIFEAQVSQQ